jgi:FKBP-type peptidyl-prolyl cis-trans isomerase
MKNSVLVSLVVFAICSACSNERETVSGQKFTILKKGDGKEIKTNQIMVLDYMFKDGKDSVWFDTHKNPYPQIMKKQVQPGNKDKLLEVINMLSKGDSTVVKIQADELFKNSFRQPRPKKIDSASQFTFYITMKEVLDSADFLSYRDKLVAKQNEKARVQQKEQHVKDSTIIANFLKDKNIAALSTPSGLRYVITKPGNGENVKSGQTAKVNYAGYLLDGKYFDTSIESVAKDKNIFVQGRGYAPYPVVVGRRMVIQGWEEGLTLMNKGCKMTLFIPSELAYGPRRGSDVIPENSVLAFDMEVVDIQK